MHPPFATVYDVRLTACDVPKWIMTCLVIITDDSTFSKNKAAVREVGMDQLSIKREVGSSIRLGLHTNSFLSENT